MNHLKHNRTNTLLSAAVDISFSPAKFAIARKSIETGEILEIHKSYADSITTGYSLLEWLEQSASDFSTTIEEISEWTIGTGPGHFSQLRMLSSTLLGLTFQRNVKLRGIPTGAALSSLFTESCTKFLFLFQLHKSIFVLSHFHKLDANHCFLLKYETLNELQHISLYINEKQKIIICEEQNINLPTPLPCDVLPFKNKEYPIESLLSINPESWDRKSIKNLLYGRSPAKIPA